MLDFLAITLSGKPPQVIQGETVNLKWQWLGEGILTLVPHRSYTQSVVISAGIHGNETAPIEILNQLVTDLLAGQLPLSVRLLVLLEIHRRSAKGSGTSAMTLTVCLVGVISTIHPVTRREGRVLWSNG